MNDEDLISISIDLRRKLYEDLKEFWINKKNISQEQLLFINSVVMSSLVAQLTHAMFQKDIGQKPLFDYIDRICAIAKEQLSTSEFITMAGIQ